MGLKGALYLRSCIRGRKAQMSCHAWLMLRLQPRALLVVNCMGKRAKQANVGMDSTLIAMLVAALGSGGILIYSESAMADVQSAMDQHARSMPGWQIHMGSTCLAAVAFVFILFCLELLGSQSKIEAWQSSWPWLPLIGLTALGTFIHIPAYAVVSICAANVFWAYRRTRSVR